MLDDVRAYAIAKRFDFKVLPWEVGEVPEYWIYRAELFDKVFDQVKQHKDRESDEDKK